MAIRTPICETLGIEHPIILGGMMGIGDARATAAVSNGGGLGTLSSTTFGVDAIVAEGIESRGQPSIDFAQETTTHFTRASRWQI